MQKDKLILISKRVAEGTASPQEIAWFLFHVDSYSKEYPVWDGVPSELKGRIKNQMQSDIYRQIHGIPAEAQKATQPLWHRFAAAAVIAIAITSIYLLVKRERPMENNQTASTFQMDILPGRKGAMLTLSNGRVINLSDKKNGVILSSADLTYDDGSSVIPGQSKANELKQSTLFGDELKHFGATASTAKGQTYIFTLPDGTKVWLNAASSLSFPTSFSNSNEREVSLTGEAYFMVKRDVKKPFRVKSAGQVVEVLGTHFNVNAYKDESTIKTTLLEGSVRVSAKHTSIVIKPGEQAQRSVGKEVDQIQVHRDVNTEEVMAWTEGYFQFKKANLPIIMRQLSRWYDVEIKYVGSIPNEEFTGKMRRDINLSDALQILKILDVKYQVKDRVITISH